jgi:membrane protease YdiL (CAAX protease family)
MLLIKMSSKKCKLLKQHYHNWCGKPLVKTMIKKQSQRSYEKLNMHRDLLILTSFILLLGVNQQIHQREFANRVVIDTLLFSVIPILIVLLLKIRFNDIGLSLENWKKILPVSLFILFLVSPLVIYASMQEDFRNYYPIWNPGLSHLNFLVLESIVLLLMFDTEFFFRGYFLFSMEAKFGNWAILLQSIPYSLLHIGKPPIEVPYSFIAGLVFGYLALRYRSVFPGLLVHWGGSIFLDSLIITSNSI